MRTKILYILSLIFTLIPAIALSATKSEVASTAIVTPLSAGHNSHNALSGRNIALWNSHGRYYNQIEGAWIWQRSRLMRSEERRVGKECYS